ncbi:hypothetical protein FSARC_2629 [Fusarium sarcochroum]|uniref:Nephrocystin 3-like N-terminal domain-containing protein n=1 Tax=Fusarium sarcochroum TaxID=1208366 RepID=A0A8H4XDM4_9HYPO|nr:hypothetical protein FSARC_2629 [Fusarium sarcochroum]
MCTSCSCFTTNSSQLARLNLQTSTIDMSASPSSASWGGDSLADVDDDLVVVDRDDVSNYNPGQILPLAPKNIEKIRSWLQPTAYDDVGGEYRKHTTSHLAGTGAWLTSSTTYQQWLQSDNCPVLLFFFRQIIEANHECRALLRDWLDQLLDYSPPLQQKLGAYKKSIDSISTDDLWKDLKLALAQLPDKVFCVADALDEMDRGNDAFLKDLEPLRVTPCLHLRLEESHVDRDISTYVQHTLGHSSIPQEKWKVIADAVPGRANGLFLYAKLAMDAFLEPGADIDQVLSQLPADLNALYTDLLGEHAQRSGVAPEIQHLILQVVTHTTRPLRLIEIADMIMVTSPDGATRDMKATKDLIRVACGPLLEILADEIVSVIHHSFTEYLKGATRFDAGSGYPILRMGPTHAELSQICMRYLEAGTMDSSLVQRRVAGLESPISEFNDEITGAKRRLKHPFFDYAAKSWSVHAHKSEASGYDQTDPNKQILGFFQNDRIVDAWVCKEIPNDSYSRCSPATPLHVVCKAGLASCAKELLETAVLESHDNNGCTPLSYAAQYNHVNVMRVLLDAGAEPDKHCASTGLKPLHLAAERNHSEAARTLLEAGVDPLTPEKNGEHGWSYFDDYRFEDWSTAGNTPLMYACQNGHLETVDVFLQFIRDIDTIHKALAWAFDSEKNKVAARIMQYPGVDINATVNGDTPLLLACGKLDVLMVESLLKVGADPNIGCEWYEEALERFGGMESGGKESGGKRKIEPTYTCLHILCGVKGAGKFDWTDSDNDRDSDALRSILLLLIEAGADVHRRTATGQTALHGASHSPLLTRLLLDAGADPNVADEAGRAPLHLAVGNDIIPILVEHGKADVNLPEANGQTPLLYYLKHRFKGKVGKFGETLLEHGADCNATDEKGNGPLHLAMNFNSHDPDDSMGLTLWRNNEVLKPLLDAGADINAVDPRGGTFLFRMCSRKLSETEIKDLIERGASPFARDFEGRTILHEQVKHEITSQLEFFVRLGLDIKAVDHHGNGLLHELALQDIENENPHRWPRSVSNWKHLVDMGLDLDQKNHAGRTPLHMLCVTNTHGYRFSPSETLPIDFVVARVKDVNISDYAGLTPLHMAATGGEFCVKKLLDAGADPAAVSHEGLTPLHLAARCKESNIVGLLLDALRAKMPAVIEGSPSIPIKGVDAQTFDGKPLTPLFYACRSGRPETVQLLLEAGADAKLARVFEACAGFEEEDERWKNLHPSTDGYRNGSAVAIKLNDTSRPRSWSEKTHGLAVNDTGRLEEVLDMIVKPGLDLLSVDGSELHNNFFFQALNNGRNYTAMCFERALDKLGISPLTGVSVLLQSKLLNAMSQTLEVASAQMLRDADLIRGGNKDKWLSLHYQTQRQDFLVEKLPHLGVDLLVPSSSHDDGRPCVLATLVRHGMTSLVDRIGTDLAKSRLQTGEWHAFGDESQPGLWLAKRDLSGVRPTVVGQEPLILEAVWRELPNMNMLQLLVNKFKVDINEPHYTAIFAYGAHREIRPSSSALLHVAKGECWWHVHQALPYLLEKGADMEIRDGKGKPPLQMAITHTRGLYSREAAEMLIRAGADVNVSDNDGQSCLSCASQDMEMVGLLIEHGATVTAAALFAAIENDNLPLLSKFLSGGADPNMRPDALYETEDAKRHRLAIQHEAMHPLTGHIEKHEEFPLFHAAKKNKTEVAKMLLDYGAHPFAKFTKLTKKKRDEDDLEWKVKETKECSILHELIFLDSRVDYFLNHPGLDVNHRAPEGCTLLHAACQSRDGPDAILDDEKEENEQVSIFRALIDAGADIQAQDNHGRNVLHCIAMSRTCKQYKKSAAYVLEKAPSLADQPDCEGKTPLYYATELSRKEEDHDIVNKMLEAGADPFVVSNDGDNLLHVLAPYLKDKDARILFKRLVDWGLDVNHRNNLGEMPIFAFYNRPEDECHPRLLDGTDSMGKITDGEPLELKYKRKRQSANSLLKELGIDFFARDNKGRGLLHVVAGNLVEKFEELMEMGLDTKLEDNEQKTPLDVAAACENQEVLALFEKKKN